MSVRVLLVDDDPIVCRAVSRALVTSGFEVSTANDAGPAIALASELQPDIVVADYNLLAVSGLEVVRACRAQFGTRVFIAVFTGDDDDERKADCLAAGADVVMLKPMSLIELRRRLTAAATALPSHVAAS